MRRWYPAVIGVLLGLLVAQYATRPDPRRWDNLTARYRALCSSVVLEASQFASLLETQPSMSAARDEYAVVQRLGLLRHCTPFPNRIEAAWDARGDDYTALTPADVSKHKLALVLRTALKELPPWPWTTDDVSWLGERPSTEGAR